MRLLGLPTEVLLLPLAIAVFMIFFLCDNLDFYWNRYRICRRVPQSARNSPWIVAGIDGIAGHRFYIFYFVGSQPRLTSTQRFRYFGKDQTHALNITSIVAKDIMAAFKECALACGARGPMSGTVTDAGTFYAFANFAPFENWKYGIAASRFLNCPPAEKLWRNCIAIFNASLGHSKKSINDLTAS